MTDQPADARSVALPNHDPTEGQVPIPTPCPPHPFAHPAETEFAAFLGFYRIRWSYEPKSFPLRWREGRVAEMFTPDFYLPEQDLYVELTTMKQSLATRKNRKVRRLRQLYPN